MAGHLSLTAAVSSEKACTGRNADRIERELDHKPDSEAIFRLKFNVFDSIALNATDRCEDIW